MEKSIKKSVHKWNSYMSPLGVGTCWINNLCDCRECSEISAAAAGEYKRALNQMILLKVYDNELPPPTKKMVQRKRKLELLKLMHKRKEEEEKRVNKNTYVGSKGTVFIVIE